MGKKKGGKKTNSTKVNADTNKGESTNMDVIQDEKEIAHFRDVQYSFLDYASYMLLELKRREIAYEKLSEDYKKYIPKEQWMKKQEVFKECILKNARFLANVIKTKNYYTDMFGFPTSKRDYLSAAYQMSKTKSTLHQLVRDWSDEGKEERDICYNPLLERLEKYVPMESNDDGSISPENRKRVLVPGSGLSRLLLEVVSRGYGGQGNEFSYQMLLVSNFMLNHVFEAHSIPIYPWTDNPNNMMAENDNNRCIMIPDVVPASTVPEGSDFSMCAGEFVESYEQQENAWDCVLTCFFIDTAPVVMEYIKLIYKILKPGGCWINLGPLLYHWQTSEAIPEGEFDERYTQSIELSYEEIEGIMKRVGFTMKESSRVCMPYADNIRSMMTTLYRGVLFVAEK